MVISLIVSSEISNCAVNRTSFLLLRCGLPPAHLRRTPPRTCRGAGADHGPAARRSYQHRSRPGRRGRRTPGNAPVDADQPRYAVAAHPAVPLPRRCAVRGLGVDDGAFRKGHRYGTILCDLERHCPVDPLLERSADTLCAWLQEHPEVEIVSWDRGAEYMCGATAGAPQAVQVADRWHLLHNLRDALMGTVDRHHAEVQASAQKIVAGPPATASREENMETVSIPASASSATSLRIERQQERRQRRAAV